MTIALSHGGPTQNVSNGKSDELLVGTAKGITTLRRDGDGWKVAGTVLPEQHISAILLTAKTLRRRLPRRLVARQPRRRRDLGLCDNGLTEKVFSIEAVEHNGATRLYVGTEPAQALRQRRPRRELDRTPDAA